jgi:membrane-associated phospholipid phosphatase
MPSFMKQRGLIAIFVVSSAVSASAQSVAPTDAPTPADLSRLLTLDGHSDEGRRTLGAFPKNLGRSFIGVFSKNNLAPFLIGAAATGIGTAFDSQAHNGLIGQAPSLSHAASTAGGLTVMAPLTVGLFAAGRLAPDTRFRAFTYDATQAVIVNGIYSEILKKAVSRGRPDGSDALSFPSGHASTAFALATVAEKHYGWKIGIPSYLAASTIGLSRISNNKHYLSDVIAGAALGVITGRTVVHQNGEPVGRKRLFSLGPMTDAQGTGVGLGASVTW